MLVGRVKWHTDFAGKIESGLFKMMAIGLGKFAGAQRYHTYAYRLGLEHVIRSVGRQVLSSGKILGGLAILEDANHNTAQAGRRAGRGDGAARRREPGAGEIVDGAGFPCDLDILILDEIGKNISGAGMDTKVVNRGVQRRVQPVARYAPHRAHLRARPERAHLQQRASGWGWRTWCTDRLVNRIDWEPTLINSLTANTPAAIRTPIHFPTDRECLERICAHGRQTRLARSDLRLDPQHAWSWRRLALEREPARRDRGKNRLSKSKPPSISNSTAPRDLISPFAPIEETAGAH